MPTEVRTALPLSVLVAEADDTPVVTVAAFDLGSNTNLPPSDLTETMAPGYDRPVGANYAGVIEAKRGDDATIFGNLDDLQVVGALLNITINYDDGSSVKLVNCGFMLAPIRAGSIGTLLGWTIKFSSYGLLSGDVLTIAPVIP